jgi:fumarylacetoacetase
MFRGARTLPAAWLSIPIAYHGRASSVVPSGTTVRRPCGQVLPKGAEAPIYSQCKVLDFELEMATVVGPGTEMGAAVPAKDASQHIFGLALMNDWSARDIQKFEYVPLGPFGGKNFATTLGQWVVTLEALEPFSCAAEAQSPPPLAYLDEGDARRTWDVPLSVSINGHAVCKSNYRHLYWTAEQQLSHHTVTGCSLETGDLLGSGTISGPGEAEYGSMLELSWSGSRTVALGEGGEGGERKFVEDHDSVNLGGEARSADGSVVVSFGECEGTLLPAQPLA